MKKLFLGSIFITILVLLISNAYATVTISGITPISATEDTRTTFTLTKDTSLVNGIPVYILVTGPSGMTINPSTGNLIWTPTNDNVGPNKVTVRADDDDGEGTPYIGTINVINVNDAPILGSIGNKETYEGFTLEFTISANDVDAGETLTYSVSNLPKGATFNPATQKFTWIPTEDQRGKYEAIEFKVTDLAGATDSENITITVNPAYCDLDDEKNIKIGDIDFDDEKYKPGEKVKVSIENVEALTDLEDLTVELCLYNLDKEEEIDCWEADETYDLDDGDEEDFEIEFEIPNNEDIGKDDDYLLIVTATADDDDGDNQCVQKNKKIRIKRDTHDVVVKSIDILPSTLKCGETAEVIVKVENQGTKDEDDVYIRLRNNELGIDLKSEKFNLDKYDGDDESMTKRFSIKIKEENIVKDYVLEAIVYFDEEDESNSGFATLKVQECPALKPKLPAISLTTDTKITLDQKQVNLHLIVTNNEKSDLDATIEMGTIGDWAEPILPQIVSLHPGENNFYFNMKIKPELTSGIHSAIVTVKPAGSSIFDAKQFTLNFDVASKEEVKKPLFTGDASTVFWIIGDIVLVIIALFFIKAIFFGGRKE